MTIEEFESIVDEYFGDRVELYSHEGDVSRVAFDDGITAEVKRFFPDDSAREGLFFLCDMWAGMDANHPVSWVWVKEAIQRAREVQICKLLIEGSWDSGSD